MKCQPNITIVDFANLVAAHGEKQLPGILSILSKVVWLHHAKADQDDDLLVNLPWYAVQNPKEGDEHEYFTNEYFTLFDT